MSTTNIKTENLELDGTKLRIFDKIGFISGENWAVNVFGGSFIEVDPNPVSNAIIGIIDSDTEAGNFEKIDHISLKPIQLLSLYLEGKLPIGSIVSAEDNGDEVIFREVPFTTKKGVVRFPVWVDRTYQMATIDINGDVV